jgi:hypothetical protein
MRSLDEFAGEKLQALHRAQLRRTPVVTARGGACFPSRATITSISASIPT